MALQPSLKRMFNVLTAIIRMKPFNNIAVSWGLWLHVAFKRLLQFINRIYSCFSCFASTAYSPDQRVASLGFKKRNKISRSFSWLVLSSTYQIRLQAPQWLFYLCVLDCDGRFGDLNPLLRAKRQQFFTLFASFSFIPDERWVEVFRIVLLQCPSRLWQTHFLRAIAICAWLPICTCIVAWYGLSLVSSPIKKPHSLVCALVPCAPHLSVHYDWSPAHYFCPLVTKILDCKTLLVYKQQVVTSINVSYLLPHYPFLLGPLRTTL